MSFTIFYRTAERKVQEKVVEKNNELPATPFNFSSPSVLKQRFQPEKKEKNIKLVNLSIILSSFINLSIYFFSVYLSIYLFIFLSILLSIYFLSIYLTILLYNQRTSVNHNTIKWYFLFQKVKNRFLINRNLYIFTVNELKKGWNWQLFMDK